MFIFKNKVLGIRELNEFVVGRFDRNCGRRDSGGGYGWDDRDHNEGDCGWYDKEYDDWDCGCGDCGGWGDNGVDR